MDQYCFACWRLSVVVCNAASRWPGAWAVRRPTLHDGPVWLHPVRHLVSVDWWLLQELPTACLCYTECIERKGRTRRTAVGRTRSWKSRFCTHGCSCWWGELCILHHQKRKYTAPMANMLCGFPAIIRLCLLKYSVWVMVWFCEEYILPLSTNDVMKITWLNCDFMFMLVLSFSVQPVVEGKCHMCLVKCRCNTALHKLLAFIRPKAGRKVGPLNWTQEHKSVWYGPPSKDTGHAPRPARDWPVPKSDLRPARRRARELWPQAIAQSSTCGPCRLYQNRPFCTVFPICYTLTVEIFRMFFIRSRLPMTTMNHEKFYGNRSVRFWEIRKTDTRTNAATLYIYIYI